MNNLRSLGKSAVTMAVIGIAAMAACTVAKADPFGNPFSAAIGANYLESKSAQNNFSDVGLHGALGVDLPHLGGASGTPSIDFDYDYNSGNGNTANTYALFVADRYYIPKILTANTFAPYVGVGIGGAEISGSGDVGSHDATNFAGKFLVGAKFSQEFIELAYQLNGKIHGYDDDGFNLSIGTHF